MMRERRLLRPGVRAATVVAIDALIAAAAFYAAYALRFGEWVPEAVLHLPFALGALIFVAAFSATSIAMRMPWRLWRYTAIGDLFHLVSVVSIAIVVTFALMFMVQRLVTVPRSVPLIVWLLLIVVLGAMRVLRRVMASGELSLSKLLGAGARGSRVPIIVLGDGGEIPLMLRALMLDGRYEVVALLTRDARARGHLLMNRPVLGGFDDLADAAAALERRGVTVSQAVLTSAVGIDDVRLLVPLAARAGVTLARAADPATLDPLGGNGEGARLPFVPIMVTELLGRPQKSIDRGAVAGLIRGRRVLVTGAGGSIGSELVRQIAAFGPAQLWLVDHGEFNLFMIDRELKAAFPDLDRRAVLSDVRDREQLFRLMAEARPDAVFHAAALKHVGMVERNPAEGVRTNLLGTRNVADAGAAAGVRTMVLVSTDKAVKPSNVMGATKRAAELYWRAADRAAGATRYFVVRFGNVLGSSGSVVPIFERQIDAGGPVTVTDPDATRFFMTIREASELVLYAAAQGMAQDAPRGDIFVLDMGRPVRIVDLARQMITLHGLRPDQDIEIVFTGLDRGEKLHEELFDEGEVGNGASYDGVLVAHGPTVDAVALAPLLARIERAVAAEGADLEVRRALADLLRTCGVAAEWAKAD